MRTVLITAEHLAISAGDTELASASRKRLLGHNQGNYLELTSTPPPLSLCGEPWGPWKFDTIARLRPEGKGGEKASQNKTEFDHGAFQFTSHPRPVNRR